MNIKNLELYYVGKVTQPMDLEQTDSYVTETAMEIGPLILVKQNNTYKDIRTDLIYSEDNKIGIRRIVKEAIEPLSSYYSDRGDKIKSSSPQAQKVYDEVEELIQQGYIKVLNLYSHRHQFWRFHNKRMK